MKITVNQYEITIIEIMPTMEIKTESFFYGCAYKALEMYSNLCRNANSTKPLLHKNGHVLTSAELLYDVNTEYGVSESAYNYINDSTEESTFAFLF